MTPAQLRMARALLQLGIRELAEKAGVDKMSVQRIESGRRAHPPTMAKIREALVAEGIVFIGAVEPFHAETVAMRWGLEPAQWDDGNQAAYSDDEEENGEDQAQSWDRADAALDPDQLAALRSYWADEARRRALTQASQTVLEETLNR